MRDTTEQASGRAFTLRRTRAAVWLGVLAAGLTLVGCSARSTGGPPAGSGSPNAGSTPTGSAPRRTGAPAVNGGRTMQLVAVGPAATEELQTAAVTITGRLRALGLEGSAEVVDGEVLVHIDPKDEAAVLELVVTSPRLLFRPVLATVPAPVNPGTAVPPSASDPRATITLTQPNTDVAYTLGPSLVGGESIESASASVHEQTGQWAINTVLTEPGIAAFNAVTKRCYAHDASCPSGQLAIVVDGRIISAPSINAETFSRDQIQIMGGFKEQEAHDLARAIRSGLPIQLKVKGS